MNPKTQYTHISGPAGQLQVATDEAAVGTPYKGIAIIAHPNPSQGGTMDNKVITTLAKAFNQSGYRSVRFNFRGIGSSEGVFDKGIGETQDLLAVIKAYASTGQFAIAGFSFGTYCISHALKALGDAGRDLASDVTHIALIGSAAGKFELAPLHPELLGRTLVLHGEDDEVVPLAGVMDWARPQVLPVTVVPSGSHFFHGMLPLLKNIVSRHLA